MRDDVTVMYYLRARYYSSGIGRFTQADTYHGDGLNLYVYAGNNPVRYIDPSGHCCKNGSGDGSSNKKYKEIKVHGNIDTEFDKVYIKNIIIYEDKDARKLYGNDLDFPQTELQWAEKQILGKGKNRILALQQNNFTISSKESPELPPIDKLKQIRTFIFRINADTENLRSAVQIQVDKLSKLFPDYNISAIYGG
ncbi:MAG: RHS repeat-associated core domain-containing protein [Lachnospiraceae bacterium]|nr:RHS repeat-associated core domain-containing protein [Lachnospiraceae bacterium]